MFGSRSLRAASIALGLYGVLGLLIAATMLAVGGATFGRVVALSTTLEAERRALVDSLHTATNTLRDTATSTSDFQRSVDSARQAADQASKLANDSAGNFRDISTTLRTLNVFGVYPLTTLSPQFDQSADQLQQLAITLGNSREALSVNGSDIGRVSSGMSLLQSQLTTVAATLDRPGVLGLDAQALLPFQVAFYGMCLLVIVQSAFAIVLGVMLYRLGRALGDTPLFAIPTQTATTTERDVVVPYRARR